METRNNHDQIVDCVPDTETKYHCDSFEQTEALVVEISQNTDTAPWLELRFQLLKDALRFKIFIFWTWAVVYAYTIASSTMFFSSLYPTGNSTNLPPSPVDAFVMTSHILVIDVSSAFFVLAGFFSAYLFCNISVSDRIELCKAVVIYTLVDVWLAALLSITFGVLYHLTQHTFKPKDLALTVIEAVTCVRAMEFRQDPQGWHSLNPTSWPILCLLYCFVLTPYTIANNERLHKCHPYGGVCISWLNCSMPIVIISLFALVHEDNNIFFMNSSSIGYRMMEYNLGLCFYNAMHNSSTKFWKFALAVKSTSFYVFAGFVCIWWAQLGVPVIAANTTCIRMYNFSPCIHMHHGFLMRGCFLGITVMCTILTHSEDFMTRIVALVPMHTYGLSACISVVLFSWPMCYIVSLLLEANFGPQLVLDNTAILVLVVPHLTFVVSLLWDVSWKLQTFNMVERWFDSSLRFVKQFCT